MTDNNATTETIKNKDAATALKHAIDGEELDVSSLLYLETDVKGAQAVRDDLIPLMIQLAQTNPEAAQQIPEQAITNLLHGMNLHEVLNITRLEMDHLNIPLIRPLLLSQAASKASYSDNEFVKACFGLIADPELETESVSAIEKLVRKLPQSARDYVPFTILYNGSAELKSRLMAINLILLSRGILPPLETLLWDSLADEDEDVLFDALKIDYIADLIPYFNKYGEIQRGVHTACFSLCQRYTHSLPNSSIERTLSRVAQHVKSLFLEFDAQFLLVREDRPSLIAQIPADYVVNHHPEIIQRLELNNKNMFAIANLAQEFKGLRLLNLTSHRVSSLPVLSQLLLAAAATNTDEGAQYFNERFRTILQNAIDAPNNNETRDLKNMLLSNLSKYNVRVRRQPNVQAI